MAIGLFHWKHKFKYQNHREIINYSHLFFGGQNRPSWLIPPNHWSIWNFHLLDFIAAGWCEAWDDDARMFPCKEETSSSNTREQQVFSCFISTKKVMLSCTCLFTLALKTDWKLQLSSFIIVLRVVLGAPWMLPIKRRVDYVLTMIHTDAQLLDFQQA